MDSVPATHKGAPNKVSWRQAVAKYEKPDLRRSVWQVVNTLIPYSLLWYVMCRSLAVSYWITLALSVVAAGFMLRIFDLHVPFTVEEAKMSRFPPKETCHAGVARR